jgi:hypothetical protein
MSERLHEVREDSHLGDNPPLYDLFVELAQLDRRIATLEALLAEAQIVAPEILGVGAPQPAGRRAA